MSTPPATATAVDERAVFVPAGDDSLFGIFTRPTVEPRQAAVIICTGGGSPTSSNRNRLSVRLCRRLAASGYHTMRFDYHGVGESTGEVRRFQLDRPFTEDLAAVAAWVNDQGVTRLLLVGSCFGARTVLAATPFIPGVEAIALLAPPPRDFERGRGQVARLAERLSLWQFARRGLRREVLAGLRGRDRRAKYARIAGQGLVAAARRTRRRLRRGPEDPLHWVSRGFVDDLQRAVRQGISTLIVYGEEDDFWPEYQAARAGRLGQVEAQADGLLTVRTIPGEIHGFTRLDIQDAVIEQVVEWAAAWPGVQGARSRG